MTQDTTRPAAPDDWEAVLAHSFGQVLGRPLSAYDPAARYGAYFSGNFILESELDRDPVWVGGAALAGKEPVVTAHLLLTPPGDLDATELVFDASRSYFLVEPAKFPDAFADDLVALSPSWTGAVLGADLGRLADRHGLDLASADLPGGAWRLWEGRIASADTLLDALRAATGLLGVTGPDGVPAGLGDSADEVDGEAHDRIAAVEDDRLRDYLAAFCDPESHDLALCLYEMEEEQDGGPLVARWDGSVDQYEVVVRRIDA
ncbi:hypothetical protein PUR61_22715 [Streptomyces sp. BE20]|uniref:hypothetical protein n=1 Tax=Streptomyces sp. BE20 TaxID=3002525 RepID=UPI002E7A19BF|nr:hypothetical protein [Streptomyces sp. BE20]MEE1824971.1 hypothetical protein [Streptomyces sp. BE20]